MCVCVLRVGKNGEKTKCFPAHKTHTHTPITAHRSWLARKLEIFGRLARLERSARMTAMNEYVGFWARVARFGLFEAKKANFTFFKIGWLRNFGEIIK